MFSEPKGFNGNITVITVFKDYLGRKIMRKKSYKKIICFVIVCLLLTLNASNVFAQNIDINFDKEEYIMSVDAPTVTINLSKDENGDYKGTTRSGKTYVSCVLSGNTGGVDRLYEIYIRWSGTNSVQSISANLLWILDTSIISPTTFYENGFSIAGLSATSGYKPVGTCYIPPEIEKVRIRTMGLKAFFTMKTIG